MSGETPVMVTISVEGLRPDNADAVIEILIRAIERGRPELTYWGYPTPGTRMTIDTTLPAQESRPSSTEPPLPPGVG